MKSSYKPIGNLVERIDERNTDGSVKDLVGVSIDKCFIKSVANTIGTDLTKYKLIRKKDFAVSLMQVSRDEKIPVAMQNDYDIAIISPAYPVFRVADENIILPEYLDLWFKRSEFDREAAFIAVGGVRGSMPWEEFCKMEVLVPSIEKQCKIVKTYKTITDRIALKQRINDNLVALAETILDSYLEDVLGDVKLNQINNVQLPDDWKVFKLTDLAECQSGYAFYKDGYDDEGVRIVDLGNINLNSEYVKLKNDKFILANRVSSSKFDKYWLFKDDLIMVMTDRKSTMELLGKTGRVYTDEELLLNQRVYRIRANTLASYLYIYLNSERVHLFHKSRALGTAQKYVNNSDINLIPIVLPPKEIFDSLNKLFDTSWQTIEHNLKEISSLIKLEEELTYLISSN